MTARLIGLYVEHEWKIDGFAASQGMPELGELSLRRFCNFMRWFFTRNAEKEADVAKFERQLWLPPPGEEPQGPWAPTAEMGGLLGLKKALGK